MFKNLNEWLCLDHGTMVTVAEAWDTVEFIEERSEPENSGRSWSTFETQLLLEMEEKGVTLSEMANILGRTQQSVYSKLWSFKNKT